MRCNILILPIPNLVGFVKIVKKHDKVMKLKDLDDWKLIVNKQLFSVSLRPHELMEALSDIVGLLICFFK